jgi:hypothetical protein
MAKKLNDMLREYEFNQSEIESAKTIIFQNITTINQSTQKYSGKGLAKLLDPETQEAFKTSQALVKQYKKQAIPVNDFCKQYIQAKASFYEG